MQQGVNEVSRKILSKKARQERRKKTKSKNPSLAVREEPAARSSKGIKRPNEGSSGSTKKTPAFIRSARRPNRSDIRSKFYTKESTGWQEKRK
jgi:hypothetical protein